ncbi:MAG: hypothetical protein WCI92_01025 [Bacteroidota bacterium]
MKTSILISSIAALCLLGTFAVAPRHHSEERMNITSTNNILFTSANTVTMLPGVVISADRKREAAVSLPLDSPEDFSYLKFNASDYLPAENISPDEANMLPEEIVTDLSYLKFNTDDYVTESTDEEIELPVNESITTDASFSELLETEFGYLRFEVDDYIGNAAEIGELPSEETKTLNKNDKSTPTETSQDFGYLKFDVINYYNSDNPGSVEQIELPEE